MFLNVIITSETIEFEEKKSSTPYRPKMTVFGGKITKNYVFPNLGQKSLTWCLSMLQINFPWFLANKKRNTKLFSKLRLVKNWQFCRGNVKRWRPKIEKKFSIPIQFSIFSQVRLYVICNNNFPLKFSNLMYLEKWSVNLSPVVRLLWPKFEVVV